jgi:hypothetical protein
MVRGVFIGTPLLWPTAEVFFVSLFCSMFMPTYNCVHLVTAVAADMHFVLR